MQQIASDEATALLQRHHARGFHVDSRVLKEVSQPGEVWMLRLDTIDAVFNLIWQSVNEARPIVPAGQPRSLRDCASRLSSHGWTFQALVDAGYPWFAKCVPIDRDFKLENLGVLVLTLATDGERRDTPVGTHYIYDGVHRSIVLAKRLLLGEQPFGPIDALLLTPRRR